MQTSTPTAVASQPAPFKFAIGQRLAIVCSGEIGEAIGRAEYPESPPSYLLRHRAADGRAVEAWWTQSALDAADGEPSAARVDTGSKPAALGIAPRIGEVWPGQGGIYAGIARGTDGMPDAHLILCATTPDSTLDWGSALKWAANLDCDGFRDWHIPSRAESALLFANLRADIAPVWHWTADEYDGSYAWRQYFYFGTQYDDVKSFHARARAVRRFPA